MAHRSFQNWTPHDTARWGREPQRLQHNWHRSALFDLDALAELIDRYPIEHYALVATNVSGEPGGGPRRWREGEIQGLKGHQVIEAIAAGGLWLNLRNVHEVDRRYAALMDGAYAELQRELPGFAPRDLRMGILISSPGARVHYHADLPGQALWQVRGRKRLHVYPPTAPYLPPEVLEDIALTGVEVNMPYRPEFDRDARVIDLAPGQMAHWPLNAPHRVDNEDCLNVSVTTEHWTEQIRRSQMINVANGVLRRQLGWQTLNRATEGAGFWAKAALQATWRRSPWARRAQRLQRPIDFRLNPLQPGRLLDIPAYYR
ncbi:MAG: hypothetical protein JNJ71_17245 [Rubrivivax sp.]|nr:hypothetical protein [Rubrivivax sp.]